MRNRYRRFRAISVAPAIAILLFGGALAFAQQGRGGRRAVEAKEPARVTAEMRSGGKVVRGAPYTAEAVTETMQTLTNGTKLMQKSTAIVYRDGEGRTRREQPPDKIGPFGNAGQTPGMIFINDPVAGVAYTLFPDTHTGYKTAIPPARIVIEPGDKPGAKRGDRPEQPPRPNKPPRPPRGGKQPPAPPGPGGEAPRAGQIEHPSFVQDVGEGEVRNESLGKKVIEGFNADGERSTIIIPVNRIGNDKPIEIVEERWKSPELRTTLVSSTSDPRWGETTYRLTNIIRGEPDKSLFVPPADYAITEGKPPGGGKRRPPKKE